MSQAVAAIIEDRDGRLLLHLRDENAPTMKHQWCLVGGGIEGEETPEEAVLREVAEETGLQGENPKLFTQFTRRDKPQLVFIFHIEVDALKQKLELGEGKELRFLSPEELLHLATTLDCSNQYLEAAINFAQRRNKDAPLCR